MQYKYRLKLPKQLQTNPLHQSIKEIECQTANSVQRSSSSWQSRRSNGIFGSIPIKVDPAQRDLFRVPLEQLGGQRNLKVAVLERDLALDTGDADFGIIWTCLVER